MVFAGIRTAPSICSPRGPEKATLQRSGGSTSPGTRDGGLAVLVGGDLDADERGDPLRVLQPTLGPLGVLRGDPEPRNRLVWEVVSVDLTGERLTASLKGVACADWMLVSADGAATLDIRGTLETPDGALIYVNYQGKADLSAGMVFPVTIYVAPRFETSDPRYAWLNKVQAVGKGVVDENLVLEYEWYELV